MNEEQMLLEIEHYFRNLYSSKVHVGEEEFGHYPEYLEFR